MIREHHYLKVDRLERPLAIEILSLYGTHKNAYVQLGLFERGVSYFQFKQVLGYCWRTPALVQCVRNAWNERKAQYGLETYEVPPGFEPEPREQREVAMDQYIIELNKGRKFKIRDKPK